MSAPKTPPLARLAGSIKLVYVIITTLIALAGVGTGILLKHDANVIKSYVDSTQYKTNLRFESVEKLISNLTTAVNKSTERYDNNFETIKSEFSDHIKNSKEIAPDDRFDIIVRLLKGIETRQKEDRQMDSIFKRGKFDYKYYQIK